MRTPSKAAQTFIRNLAAPGQTLKPERVVEAAKPETSPIHKYFTWDDTEAGIQWRLHEARNLIRMVITVLPAVNEPVRMFVSLSNERGQGYRRMDDVLNARSERERMIEDALFDADLFRRKYRHLKEAAEAVEAMNKFIEGRRRGKKAG